jgi:hypothetical protein
MKAWDHTHFRNFSFGTFEILIGGVILLKKNPGIIELNTGWVATLNHGLLG